MRIWSCSMWGQRNYLENAKKHEEVFRNILRSRKVEEGGLTLDEVHKRYSEGERYGKWTILDFIVGPSNDLGARLSENEALFASQNIATLSGSGSVAKYKVNPDNSVEFDSNISAWMS